MASKNAAEYVNLKEFDKFVKDLKKAGRISDREVQSAITPVAAEMSLKLKAAAPTQAISNAIGAIHQKAQYPRSIYIGVLNARKHGAQLAWIFEYGTVERSYKDKTGLPHKTGRIQPTFFFRNTVLANENKLATDLMNNLLKIVQNKIIK